MLCHPVTFFGRFLFAVASFDVGERVLGNVQCREHEDRASIKHHAPLNPKPQNPKP